MGEGESVVGAGVASYANFTSGSGVEDAVGEGACLALSLGLGQVEQAVGAQLGLEDIEIGGIFEGVAQGGEVSEALLGLLVALEDGVLRAGEAFVAVVEGVEVGAGVEAGVEGDGEGGAGFVEVVDLDALLPAGDAVEVGGEEIAEDAVAIGAVGALDVGFDAGEGALGALNSALESASEGAQASL